MARSVLIPVPGKIVEQVQPNLYKVALPNGHELLGHLSEKIKMKATTVLPGTNVSLELTPRDLSKGRILQVLE